MLDIHAISYHNIGPFADKKLSVFFVGGKYLIKAPIGSGKSFLFFDGPLYGLYKAAERRMLNIHHKTGYIKVIFSVNGEYYLVTRQLSQGKSKESCTSQQFHIQANEAFLHILQTDEIIQHDVDIQTLLEKNNVRVEEITYKNESDLQQTLATLLPPREVFTSTMFLLQESQNIFELQPAERIEILKNVFDLLSIDEAKDRIADKKREVQLQKKILGDTQQSDAKLRMVLGSLIQSYNALIAQSQWSVLEQYKMTFREREHIVDKITLEQCSIPDTLTTIVDTINTQLKIYQAQQQSYQQTVDHKKQNIKRIQDTIQSTESSIHTAKSQIQTISAEITQANIPDAQTLKTTLANLQNTQTGLEQNIDVVRYDTIVQTAGLEVSGNAHAIAYAHDVISACIQSGKLLAQETKNNEIEMKNLQDRYDEYNKQLISLEIDHGTPAHIQLQQEIARTIERIASQKEVLLAQKKSLEQQAHEIQLSIKKVEDRITTITTDNPDIQACIQEIQVALQLTDMQKIEQIQTIVSKYLGDKQVAQLNSELATLVEKQEGLNRVNALSEIEKQIQELEKQEQLVQSTPESVLQDFFQSLDVQRKQIQEYIVSLDYNNKSKAYQEDIAKTQHMIESIKTFLQDIDRKSVEESYQQWQTISSEKQTIEKQLQAIDTLVQEQQERQKQIDILQVQIQQREQDLNKLSEEQKKEEENLNIYIKENIVISPDTLSQREQEGKMVEKSFHSINDLVRDHASNQQKLNALIQEEKILTNLHQIVSRELLLLVLGESLSILTDIINVYLAQVFSLQLYLEIQKASGDKIELAAYCEDEKGKREVKSLSGGQKTILKLVWMLAISSFLRAPLLFLDETINNIDKDTVGKVADMLSDFVKKQDIKLYTITHSEQIQMMNIWDGVIEIGS